MAEPDRELLLYERLLQLRTEQELAREHPAHLLDHVRMIDEKTGAEFRFHLTDPDSGWYWQREVLDGLYADPKTIILKARQLGITWLCGGYQLWEALTRPGTLHLCFRQREDDVVSLINRIWDMFESLPEHLRFGVKVLKPASGHRPSTEIVLLHPGQHVPSRIQGFPSTEHAGRGSTAATVLYDEAGFIERFRKMWTGTVSTVGASGKMFVVSTANGRSDPLDGEGNFFHRLWVTSKERGLSTVFLGWYKHPDRGEGWLEQSQEAQALEPRERAQEYPTTAQDAFRLSEGTWFNVEALEEYQHGTPETGVHVRSPLYSFDFKPGTKAADRLKARKDQHRRGMTDLFREPEKDHLYGIGADVSSGGGRDYSAAYVVDLTNMELVAEFHGKLEPDLLAYQIHFLGKYFGKFSGCARDAWVAIEAAGSGWGNAVITSLRDGREGRPGYTHLYRHTFPNRPDHKQSMPYGFPINGQTRTNILTQLNKVTRERSLPWLTSQLLSEMNSFTENHKSGTVPRASIGNNDDCVLAAGITLELYRKRGHWPDRKRALPRRGASMQVFDTA